MANLLGRLWINKLWQDQRGQDMTEYALLTGLMASTALAVVPDMISIAMHIVSVVPAVSQIAMHAAGLE
jgi:Flp pilus assembly pilin Flp